MNSICSWSLYCARELAFFQVLPGYVVGVCELTSSGLIVQLQERADMIGFMVMLRILDFSDLKFLNMAYKMNIWHDIHDSIYKAEDSKPTRIIGVHVCAGVEISEHSCPCTVVQGPRAFESSLCHDPLAGWMHIDRRPVPQVVLRHESVWSPSRGRDQVGSRRTDGGHDLAPVHCAFERRRNHDDYRRT